MKSAKPPAGDTPSHRRSQPVRQARTNPLRGSAHNARSGPGRDSLGSGPVGEQPIDIFPAITHFADTMAALPKELVRHFTLLKEVDAKIFAPEEQLFKLIAETGNVPSPDPRPNNSASSIAALASAPMSVQGSSSGAPMNTAAQLGPTADDTNAAATGVFDPSNLPRRQLFRQTAFKIQEMLVSLEEKNHVISTANEALQRQLARAEDVWPHLENEFSDEAKWGSTTHWAYPENRNGKASHNERARRDGAAAISAAAQALVDQAAARSDARKQAVQAKKNLKNQHQDSDVDDHDNRPKEKTGKRAQSGKVRKPVDANNVGLGISTSSTTNGNPPPKRRKVEKVANGGAPMERAMSSVFGSNAPKAKTNSPRETPAPEGGPKKRKALPSGSGQSKKKNGAPGVSPSTTSSPVLTALPEPKAPARPSPAPGNAPRPASARARQNSLQSNADNGRTRPAPTAATKSNGAVPVTPDAGSQATWSRPNDTKPTKEASVPVKEEMDKKDTEKTDVSSGPAPSASKKEVKADEIERKSESVPPLPQNPTTVTTKSGRASKPSTPALATFQEAAAARSRSSRNTESGHGSKKGHKKSASVSQAAVPPPVVAPPPSILQAEEETEDIDADEPTYCYCNSVSYGEMVACDADECTREWFHLACVGLKVAPGSKTKWYCEDCKERLKMGGKKSSGR